MRSDQLDRANGQLIAALTLFDQVIGVALGAMLFSVASSLPFAIDALTFILGAAIITAVRTPLQGDRADSSTVRADIAEGMRFLLRHRFLRGMMAAVTISNLAGNVAFGVFVILVVEELDASETTFGLVLGIGAIGGVLGSLVASRLTERLGHRRVLGALPSPSAKRSLLSRCWAASSHRFACSAWALRRSAPSSAASSPKPAVSVPPTSSPPPFRRVHG